MRNIMRILIVILSVLLIWGVTSYYKKNKKEAIKQKIEGIITDINVSRQGMLEVKVGKQFNYLGYYGISERRNIKIGDSISKQENDDKIKIYRKLNDKWELIEVY